MEHETCDDGDRLEDLEESGQSEALVQPHSKENSLKDITGKMT
jgi:hypothetical protein